MSKRFKFNVLLSGYQNFNDVFAAQGSRIYNGFSRLVIPKPLPMPRPDCKYYQQDYVKRTTRDLVRLVLSEPLKNATLTHKISHGPLTANWLTTVRRTLFILILYLQIINYRLVIIVIHIIYCATVNFDGSQTYLLYKGNLGSFPSEMYYVTV